MTHTAPKRHFSPIAGENWAVLDQKSLGTLVGPPKAENGLGSLPKGMASADSAPRSWTSGPRAPCQRQGVNPYMSPIPDTPRIRASRGDSKNFSGARVKAREVGGIHSPWQHSWCCSGGNQKDSWDALSTHVSSPYFVILQTGKLLKPHPSRTEQDFKQ